MLELALRLRIGGFEAAECLFDLCRCPLRQSVKRSFGGRGRPCIRRPQLGARRFARFSVRPCRSFASEFFHHDFGILSTMVTDNAADLEPTIFSATLTPHRSLGRVG